MPEIKKRIVIASVLKPVSDTRMTKKIATTLAHDDRLDVHVIGYPSAYSSNEKITFHSFAPFGRMSWKRFATAFTILRKIRKLDPAVLIVATHELLGVALLAKLLGKTKVVYDIQENYYLNILHTNAFNSLLKYPIAVYVRMKEVLASNWVDHFFVAEEIYTSQLGFIGSRKTVLANKVIPMTLPPLQVTNPLALVFTGTLARTTGVFDAIKLAKELHNVDNRTRLTIIGYSSLEAELNSIKAEILDKPFIQLMGGSAHVSHEEIVQAISQSNWGVISYEQNKATKGRIPTKLYEYLTYGLPIIFTQDYPEWEVLARAADHPFVLINPSKPEISKLISSRLTSTLRGTFPDWVTWKNEESKLQTAISAL